jgi:hypothetical protein
LNWKASLSCASGTTAATPAPAICRIRNMDNTDFQLGWLRNGDTCMTHPVKFGPNGAFVMATQGVGGPYNMQLLCKSPDVPKPGEPGPASAQQLPAMPGPFHAHPPECLGLPYLALAPAPDPGSCLLQLLWRGGCPAVRFPAPFRTGSR